MLRTSTRTFNIICTPAQGEPYIVGTENYMDVAQRRMYAIWGTDNRPGYSYKVEEVKPKRKRARR